MLKSTDYLKPFTLMSNEEKSRYLERVVKWTDETYPQLCALADSYDAAHVKDFDEGLKLATALTKAKDFVSNAYRYDVKRRLQRINMLLSEVRQKSGLAKQNTRPANDTHHYTARIAPQPRIDEEGVSHPVQEDKPQEVSGRRPEHISQYIDLLPDELKKESALLSERYDMLAHWRGRAEYLADDPRATRDMLAEAAQQAVKYEKQILNFWERVDMEYSRKTGKQVDEEVMDRLRKESEQLNREVEKKAGEYTKAEIDAMTDEQMKEACKQARILANKKFIRRNDLQLTEERKEQIRLRARELSEWGIELSRKQMEVVNSLGLI